MARRQQDQENHLRGKKRDREGAATRPLMLECREREGDVGFAVRRATYVVLFADLRRQLGEQQSCLDLRTESKMSLLSEMQDFLKRRGEVEFEYAKGLERLCERFERSIKQRSIKYESPFSSSSSSFNPSFRCTAGTRSGQYSTCGPPCWQRLVAWHEIVRYWLR